MARILVVDDEEGLRFTFKSFLQEKGHEVIEAADYEQALSRLDAATYDLVILDVVLPQGRTGIEVLQQIRTKGQTCPVIIITGQPEIETAAEAVRLGAYDYVPKPVKEETLLRLTGKALRLRAVELAKQHAEKETIKYKRHLEAVFDSVDEGIVSIDSRMAITSMNKAAEKISGVRSDEWLGKELNKTPAKCLRDCMDAVSLTVPTGTAGKEIMSHFDDDSGVKKSVIIKSFPLKDEMEDVIGCVLVLRDVTRIQRLERELEQRHSFQGVVGKSSQMQKIYNLVEDLTDTEATVLITGESGTGKDLLAAAIHYHGPRSTGPFIKVNCAGLAENLLDSELFGHVKGAFTGADRDRKGRFETAHGGTLFLDEIGDMAKGLQVKLLRVLQDKEFERVGESRTIRTNARLIAATNHDLLEKIKTGEFREDLYYRLNVVKIHIPPLKKRREDIPLLIESFRKHFNETYHKHVQNISDDVWSFFMNHNWPGNIRQLKHAIEHAFIVCKTDTIALSHLPEDILLSTPNASGNNEKPVSTGLTPEMINASLVKSDGNKSKAARLLGIDRSTLYRKMRQFKI